MKDTDLKTISKALDNLLLAHYKLLKFRLEEKCSCLNWEEWVEKCESLVEEQEKAMKELNALGVYFNFNTLEATIK